MRTLILSDLHLCSKHCHAEQILDTLERQRFDRLILNGDTLHSLNLRKFKCIHWHIVDELRKLAHSREVILIRGNHDQEAAGAECGFGSHDVLPALLGMPMIEDFQFELAGRSYLVLHGDQFDPTLNNVLLSEMAGCCYGFSKKINKKLAKWLKKKTRKWSRVLEGIKTDLIAHARAKGFDGVVTGHTHFADDAQVGQTHYLNSGCWTEPPCSYVFVESGRMRLHQLPD